jgi:mRNA interferase MazF
MSYRAYHPRRGDLVHLNFSPSSGHEMADRHYAIILSPASYNRKSGMTIVCAITSRVRGGPFEVAIPPGILPDKRGVGAVQSVVVSDSVRQVDYREREMSYVTTAPGNLVEEVLEKLLTVLEDDSV